MRNFFLGISGILAIAWLVGYFAYSTGKMIHVLLILSITALIFGLARSNKVH